MITTEDPWKWNVPNVALMRRRTLLAGTALGGAALLAGCSEEPGPEQDEHSSAANRLRERSAADSAALLARYDATLAAHPNLAARLGPLRVEVARHADAFTEDKAGKGGAATPSLGATPAGQPVHSAVPASGASTATSESAPKESEPNKSVPKESVPEDEKAARAALADAERKLADARAKTLAAAPPELARLLASVAAAGAAHAYLLTEAGT